MNKTHTYTQMDTCDERNENEHFSSLTMNKTVENQIIANLGQYNSLNNLDIAFRHHFLPFQVAL